MRSPSVIAMATQVTSMLLAAPIKAVTIPPAPLRYFNVLSWVRKYSTGPRLVAIIRRLACINCGGEALRILLGVGTGPFLSSLNGRSHFLFLAPLKPHVQHSYLFRL